MATIWDKCNRSMNTAAVVKGTDYVSPYGFREVPHGLYEVDINCLGLTASQEGEPSVFIRFKILDGEYKDGFLSVNQPITQAFQVHTINEFLRDLGTKHEVEFVSYMQYAKLLKDMHETIESRFVYLLHYVGDKMEFPAFEIKDVYDLD